MTANNPDNTILINLLNVWAKDMSDGTLAVGLFNRGETAEKVAARWK